MKHEILRLSHIYKSYNNILALNDFSLNLFKGEAVAVVGLNGAGKTSIANYLTGQISVESGSVYFDENKVKNCTLLDPKNLGIFFVNNVPSLAPELSVAENLYLPFAYQNKGFLIKKAQILIDSQACLDAINIKITASAIVKDLSIYEQHLIEFAQAYLYKAKIVIIDDAFSGYSPQYMDIVNQVIQSLKKLGISFLFLTHEIEKALRSSDRILIIKEGENIKSIYSNEYNISDISQWLVGSDHLKNTPYTHVPDKKTKVEFNIASKDKYAMQLKTYRGEILGILDYNNQLSYEIIKILFEKTNHAKISGQLEGRSFSLKNFRQAIKLGIGFMLEHGSIHELFNSRNVEENLSVLILKRLKRNKSLFINSKLFDVIAEDYDLHDLCNKNRLKQLNSYDRQRVLLSRWQIFGPKILICIKPFSQLDPISKNITEVYFDKLSVNGTTIIIICSDFSVISSVCDRIMLYKNHEELYEVFPGSDNQTISNSLLEENIPSVLRFIQNKNK